MIQNRGAVDQDYYVGYMLLSGVSIAAFMLLYKCYSEIAFFYMGAVIGVQLFLFIAFVSGLLIVLKLISIIHGDEGYMEVDASMLGKSWTITLVGATMLMINHLVSI